jgi:hypothetical protein
LAHRLWAVIRTDRQVLISFNAQIIHLHFENSLLKHENLSFMLENCLFKFENLLLKLENVLFKHENCSCKYEYPLFKYENVLFNAAEGGLKFRPEVGQIDEQPRRNAKRREEDL